MMALHGTLIPESTKSVEQIDDCSVDTNARALAAQNSSCGNETSLIAYISSARKVCDDDDDSSVESEVLIGVRPPSGAPVGWAESSTPSAIPASERTSPACLSSLPAYIATQSTLSSPESIRSSPASAVRGRTSTAAADLSVTVDYSPTTAAAILAADGSTTSISSPIGPINTIGGDCANDAQAIQSTPLGDEMKTGYRLI